LGCAMLGAISYAKADAEHDLLGKLTGHWVLRGTIGKRTTTHDVDAKWILKQEYVEVHEVSREKNKDGTPQYEAVILLVWDPKKKEYASQWMDTTGYNLFVPESIGHAKSTGSDNIQFYWGNSDDGIHTTFAYDARQNSWKWDIDNLIKGKEVPFARLALTRH